MTSVDPYIGLWRRIGIWRSNGQSDTTTLVLWFQGAQWHIDSRGFAGSTHIEGERCEWHPDIADPPGDGSLDAGLMRFDAPDRLHEAGIDGSYVEDWERIDAGPVHSQREVLADGRIRFVLETRHWRATAEGLPGGAAQFAFAALA